MKTSINIKAADLAWDSKNGHCVRLYLQDKSGRDAAAAFIDGMKEDRHYAAVLGEVTKTRSPDANAYAWVLLDKLSEKLNVPKEDIYKNMIKEMGGVSEVLSIPDASVEMFSRSWESHGIGWPCVVIGPSVYPAGYTLVEAFYGSSTYDNHQMHRLIDLIVQECKQVGIETMTPEELYKLKGLCDEE